MSTIPSPPRIITLALKGEYFDAIREGSKPEEYRLTSGYWRRRLEGREYDLVELTRGYPARNDATRRIRRVWRGYRVMSLTHPHFGPDEVEVFAIDVSQPA